MPVKCNVAIAGTTATARMTSRPAASTMVARRRSLRASLAPVEAIPVQLIPAISGISPKPVQISAELRAPQAGPAQARSAEGK